jgi:hypothetical protein
MDPLTLMLIFTIVVVVFIINLYKRQNNKVTSNLHADNLKQLLTLRALEYKFSADADTETEPQSLLNEITQLINSYERGEMQADAFQSRMDHLLNGCN